MPSLASRRRSFIWKDPQPFKPVERHEVRGVDIVLGEIDEIIRYLKYFDIKKKIDVGGGVLFYGPSGAGKTHLTRYLVSASGVRAVDGWRFPLPRDRAPSQELVAEDIHDFYALAREYVKRSKRPIIIFFDEFDKKAADEMEDQLRAEIDGMEGRTTGILLVVTAAVESIEDLDAGLFREGRICIHMPLTRFTVRGNEEVLDFYIKQFPHSPEIDIKSIARVLGGKKTPAALKQLVQDSYRDVCLENTDGEMVLEQRHLIKRCMREMLGLEVENTLSAGERWKVACHEAGHAALARHLGFPVRLVTIMPVLDAEQERYGTTITGLPEGVMITREILENQMACCFGGAQAERLFGHVGFIDDDPEKATTVARELVDKYLCGRRTRQRYGPMTVEGSKDGYSPKLKKLLEDDTSALLKQAESRARLLLKKIGKARVKRVAEALIKQGTLLQKDLDRLLS